MTKNDVTSATSSAVKWGLVSTASAIAGGLAVAWWYRKTLSKLQNPIEVQDQYEKRNPEQAGEAPASAEGDKLPYLIKE